MSRFQRNMNAFLIGFFGIITLVMCSSAEADDMRWGDVQVDQEIPYISVEKYDPDGTLYVFGLSADPNRGCRVRSSLVMLRAEYVEPRQYKIHMRYRVDQGRIFSGEATAATEYEDGLGIIGIYSHPPVTMLADIALGTVLYVEINKKAVISFPLNGSNVALENLVTTCSALVNASTGGWRNRDYDGPEWQL